MERQPGRVRIVEVGPRDGLQNEPRVLATDTKLRLIQMLAGAGLAEIEVTSFVSPDRVPQLADADDLFKRLEPSPGVRYSALVPNQRGLDRALAAGARAIAFFTAASESLTQHNIGMTVQQSLEGFRAMMPLARAEGLWVRAYISTAFVCPYEGVVEPDRVLPIVTALAAMGVDEVSLGDTIGRAAPEQVRLLLDAIEPALPRDRTACHFHDTHGRALENVVVALDAGVRVLDSSVAGAGGCPFAPGAAGNLATEKLVAMLHARGLVTGVDEARLAEAARYLFGFLTAR